VPWLYNSFKAAGAAYLGYLPWQALAPPGGRGRSEPREIGHRPRKFAETVEKSFENLQFCRFSPQMSPSTALTWAAASLSH